MEKNSTFFVCFYKSEDGEHIAHGESDKNDFPDNFLKEITIGPKKESAIPDLFLLFCKSILAYMDMLPMIAVLGSVITHGIRDSELTEFCSKNSLKKYSDDKRDIFEFEIEKYPGYRSINERALTGQFVSKQVPKMLLIGVVSSLDYHLAQLMKQVLRKNPKMISESDKQIAVKDIFRSETLDEFKDFLLDREIDNISRDSFEDQISWFEKKLSINRPIKDEYQKWSSLIEIIERRNLFAHADGVVNNTYLKKTNQDAKNSFVHKDEELFASPKYFKASIENICEFGVKISQVVWRKLYPEESDSADLALGNFGYNLIERGEYKLASDVLEFAVNGVRSKKNEQRRRIDIVNLANAYKLTGKNKEGDAVLESEDWTIVSDEFAISVAAIRGDVDGVISYMKRLAQSGVWMGDELEQWPVFFHVRDDLRFGQEFSAIYGREFVPAPKNRHRVLGEVKFRSERPKARRRIDAKKVDIQ